MKKRIIISMVMLLTILAGANAMSYEQARDQALFLTDKMAYELNLTDAQYDAAYQINLDYLMSVTTVDDVYSDYWQRRNYDLEMLLQDWQWQAFCAASYFFRPLYWGGGSWHFGIYARYPERDFFYFDHRPAAYLEFHGGPYHDRPHYEPRYGDHFRGPRDNCFRYGGSRGCSRDFAMGSMRGEGRMSGVQRGNSGMSGVQRGSATMRESSTRYTVGSEGGSRPQQMRTNTSNTFMGSSGQRGSGQSYSGSQRGGGQSYSGSQRGSGQSYSGSQRGSGQSYGGVQRGSGYNRQGSQHNNGQNSGGRR